MYSFSAFIADRDILELTKEFGGTLAQTASFIASLPSRYPQIFGRGAPQKAPHKWESLLFGLLDAEFPA